jgi:peroxiredoxin
VIELREIYDFFILFLGLCGTLTFDQTDKESMCVWWRWFLTILAASFVFAVSSAGYWVYKQVEKKDVEIERLQKFRNRQPRNDLPHIGYLAPKIELPNGKEETVALAGSGKPTLVLFWTAWSSHCQNELKKLERLYQAKGQEVQFLLVNDTENDDEAQARALAEKDGLGAAVLYDREGQVTEDYGIEVYPTGFLVGTDGKIKDRWTGSLSDQEWQAKLAKLSAPANASTANGKK